MAKQQELHIHIPSDLEAHYSNIAMIAHTNNEFVVDFAQMMPNMPGTIKARVILSPEHAKRLLAALKDNVERYEKTFGQIVQNGVEAPIFNFGGKIGQA